MSKLLLYGQTRQGLQLDGPVIGQPLPFDVTHDTNRVQ